MIIYLSVLVLISGIILSLAFFLPRIPYEMINLPNKEYWFNSLYPERKEKALHYITISLGMLNAITVTFLIGIMELLFEAGRTGRATISQWVWAGAILYIVGMLFMVYKMHMKFYVLPNERKTEMDSFGYEEIAAMTTPTTRNLRQF